MAPVAGEHRPREIDVHHLHALDLPLGFAREISRSTANIHEPLARLQLEVPDRERPPAPIDPQAEHPIQEVVAGCDGIEHRANLVSIEERIDPGGGTRVRHSDHGR